VNVGIGIAAVPRVLLTVIIARLLVVGCWLLVVGCGPRPAGPPGGRRRDRGM